MPKVWDAPRIFDEVSLQLTAALLNNPDLIGELKGIAQTYFWEHDIGVIRYKGAILIGTRWPDGSAYYQAAIDPRGPP